MRLAPGTTFAGDFALEARMGRGAGGEVWRVTHLPTQRRRALKILSAAVLADEVARRRFEVEVRVGAAIRSPHLCDVLGVGVHAASGRPWILMEELTGETLDDAVARDALVPFQKRTVLDQLASVLAAAHAAGVIHRDVKPANVFVESRDGAPFVRLLDFGVAKVAHGAGVTSEVGTPTWMAPEQVIPGETIAPSADVWAFGLVAFFVLTGHRYWRGDGFDVMVEWTDVMPLASARAAELGARLPPGFDAWLARCVARDPARRFAAMVEAVAALDAVLVGPATATAPAVAVAPSPRVAAAPAWLLGLALFGVVLLVVIPGIWVWNRTQTDSLPLVGTPRSQRGAHSPARPRPRARHAARRAGDVVRQRLPGNEVLHDRDVRRRRLQGALRPCARAVRQGRDAAVDTAGLDGARRPRAHDRLGEQHPPPRGGIGRV